MANVVGNFGPFEGREGDHVEVGEGAAFLAEGRDIVLNTLAECTSEERKDQLVLTEIIRANLKKYFRKHTGTRPMIVPVIIDI